MPAGVVCCGLLYTCTGSPSAPHMTAWVVAWLVAWCFERWPTDACTSPSTTITNRHTVPSATTGGRGPSKRPCGCPATGVCLFRYPLGDLILELGSVRDSVAEAHLQPPVHLLLTTGHWQAPLLVLVLVLLVPMLVLVVLMVVVVIV